MHLYITVDYVPGRCCRDLVSIANFFNRSLRDSSLFFFFFFFFLLAILKDRSWDR